MRPAVLLLPAALLATLAAGGTVPTRHTAESQRLARIRAHFDSVLVELQAPTAVRRTPGAAARRHALMDTLRAYRDRGDFPRNYDFPGRAVPYFVDRETGARCAVAHLLQATGRGDIVARVARADNNAWVAQLAGDTAFTGWLRANGISLAEAARIQVPYMSQPIDEEQRARNAIFAVVSPIVGGASLVTGFLNARGNADGHSGIATGIGIASGIATGALGFISINKPGVPVAASAAGAALGGASLVLALRTLDRRSAPVVPAGGQPRDAEAPRVSVAPWIPAGGGGAGLSMAVRF